MEKNYRLFLRNLPIDIGCENLRNFFAQHGNVTKIDVKEKIQSDGGKIGFIEVTTTDARLNTCFRLAGEKSFGGRVIQVQLAKESYLDRLKREREEAAAAARSDRVTSLGPAPEAARRQIEKINIKVPTGARARSNRKKFDFEDARENSRDARLSPDPPADFSWDPALREPTIPADDSVQGTNKASHCRVEKPQGKALVRSEIKKLAAMEEMNETFLRRRELITRALRTVDGSGRKSNKIVFSQNDEATVANEKMSAAVSLFDNEDNSDDEDRHADKFEHDEARCAKLKLSLSNRNRDKRFVIDERFLNDAEQEANDDGGAVAVTASDAAVNETEWQLNILEKVLGKPIERRMRRPDTSGEGKKNKRKVYPMIRYDPDDEAYQKYELAMRNAEIEPKEAKKPRRAVEREEAAPPPPPPPPPPPVSGEIYWKVSENLKESFNTQGEFSLLKSFGTAAAAAAAPNDKDGTSDYVGVAEKCMEYGMKDAFKYESSSSSDDQGPSTNYQMGARSSQSIRDDDREEEPFFFVKNDPRFREAMEFFTKRAPVKDFASVRRQLKQIVRSKIRNNARRNDRWRNSKVAQRPANIR